VSISGTFRLRDLLRDKTGFTVRPEVPTGIFFPFAGTVAPSGYLICDGSVVSRETYSALFAVIGIAYNTSGESASHFRIPDLRGRTPIGPNGNGSAENNESRSVGAYGGDTRLQTHTHTGTTGNQSADHSHSGTTGTVSADHTHGVNGNQFGTQVVGISSGAGGNFGVWADAGGNFGFRGNHGHSTGGISANHTHGFTTGGVSANHTHSFTSATHNQSAGSGQNMPPFVVSNYIIKT
jgi:microcystin-dependent protein